MQGIIKDIEHRTLIVKVGSEVAREVARCLAGDEYYQGVWDVRQMSPSSSTEIHVNMTRKPLTKKGRR